MIYVSMLNHSQGTRGPDRRVRCPHRKSHRAGLLCRNGGTALTSRPSEPHEIMSNRDRARIGPAPFPETGPADGRGSWRMGSSRADRIHKPERHLHRYPDPTWSGYRRRHRDPQHSRRHAVRADLPRDESRRRPSCSLPLGLPGGGALVGYFCCIASATRCSTSVGGVAGIMVFISLDELLPRRNTGNIISPFGVVSGW